MNRKSLAMALIVAGACTLGVISASAQSDFSVNYFANNGVSGAPDATVRVTNPGTSNGNVCAMIYVFDNDQQMDECCGCPTTPDGLRTFSLTKDLTSNPLVGTVVNHGDIKLLGWFVNGSPCDPTLDLLMCLGPTPTCSIPTSTYNLRAWATHVQNKVGSAYPITESAFSDAQLSAGELSSLAEDCFFIEHLGSGHGICSCGSGD
jgi:hypothetical protein